MTQRIYKIQDVKFSVDLGQIKSWQPIIAALPGLKSWNSADSSFVTTSANKVVSLNTKASGSGFVQNTAASRGSIVANSANNHDALKLDVNTFMTYSGAMSTGTTAKFCKVLVMKAIGTATSNQYILANVPAGDYLYLNSTNRTIDQRIAVSSNVVSTPIGDDALTLVIVDANLESGNLSIISSTDNVVYSKAMIDSPNITSSAMYLGAGSATAYKGGDMEFAEIMIFDRTIIGTATYDTVREYIKDKYNI